MPSPLTRSLPSPSTQHINVPPATSAEQETLLSVTHIHEVCTFLDLTLMPLHILEMKEKGGGVRIIELALIFGPGKLAKIDYDTILVDAVWKLAELSNKAIKLLDIFRECIFHNSFDTF
ncbi:hypothetical protein Tco_0240778 [Tanacetum coccineum]